MAVLQVIGQFRQQFGTDLPTCLSVDTRRTSTRVLPNTLGCGCEDPGSSDQPIHSIEPLAGMSRSEFREMFKFAKWVTH
jgi:hypothetical protein